MRSPPVYLLLVAFAVLLLSAAAPALATQLVFSEDRFDLTGYLDDPESGLPIFPELIELSLDLSDIDATAGSFRVTVSGLSRVIVDESGGYSYLAAAIVGLYAPLTSNFTGAQLVAGIGFSGFMPGIAYTQPLIPAPEPEPEPGLFSWSATSELFLDHLVGDYGISELIFGVTSCDEWGDCDGGGSVPKGGPGFSIAPVPEPSTASLFSLGLVGIAAMGRPRGAKALSD